MGSNPAAADMTVALIPAPTGSSSSLSAVVRPRRNAYSVLQLVRALFYGAPAIPVLEDGHPAGADERQLAAVQGRVRAVVAGTMNSYLSACGRIPMLCPKGSLLDLNAAAGALAPPPERGGVPVICPYCNRMFCIGVYEVPWLNPPPGRVFPELPAPAAAGFVSPPALEPMYYGGGAGPGPSSRATSVVVAVLQVCSNPRHFMVRLGRLMRLPRNGTSLVWRHPSSLGVVPSFVVGGGGGGRLQRRRATAPARPLDKASTSSSAGGANRNFVLPGDESMVQLTLRQNRHDPLQLTLGWR
ncbi:unnamed protein product [Urochloa decumbens]|uniref:Uncharacterized protein n=1 Tax=Urochloa decumbens TaxID=240449 RepID=A0ABC9EFS6_9POAL